MDKFYGYMGKIAHVDLSKNRVKIKEIPKEYCRLYIGGSGLAARYVYDMTDGSTDPLSPENILVVMTGPITGTSFPTSGRFAVCGKSPLTNGWGEATASGFWGPELKFAGFDGLVIYGKSKMPVYIFAEDSDIKILQADHLWGRDTYDVEAIIRSDHHDKKIKVLSIGRAGENLCKISAIINDGGRAAARCGLGAVMGSKNLKAIAVKGNMKIEVSNPERLLKVAREVIEIIQRNPKTQSLRRYGTAALVEVLEPVGDLPTKYWSKGSWPEGAEKLSGQTMAKTILRGIKACYNCPIACGRIVEVTNLNYAMKGKGPEYETIAALGSLCLNDNLEAVAKANDLCNRYGLDTISTGSVIAFAMECYEHGILNEKYTGELKLSWGDPNLVLTLISLIAERKGLGNLLADGVKRAAEKIGIEAEKIAVHVRGLELAMHDPRAFTALALQYATMPRGACHTAFSYIVERDTKIPELGLEKILDRHSTDGKAYLVKVMQDYMTLYDSLALCKFLVHVGVSPSKIIEGFSAVTGWDTSLQQLLVIGERIFNLKRCYNIKCGTGDKRFDILPQKVLKPFNEGGTQGYTPNLDIMLPEYYELRGWNKNGTPTSEKLLELGLETKPLGYTNKRF